VAELRDPARRVSPRARTLWQVECGAIAAVAVVGLLAAALAWDDHGARWLVVAVGVIAAIAYAVVVPQWRYAVHRWEATATAVYTQRGWWARERRIAPLSRVQTVDLAQGALGRVFGLATVTVTTASAAGPLRIDGLDLADAVRLVDELTAKADLVEGDAT
jgi:membrane protein YdbS with pleckstrin-like domain